MDDSVGYALIGAFALIGWFLRTYYPWLFYDIRLLYRYIRLVMRMKLSSIRNPLLVDLFVKSAKGSPEKTCLVFRDQAYTYRDIDIRSNQFANFVDRKGCLEVGETVAFFMYNEPFFVWAWLGLAKLGITCAFLNYNVRNKSLIHCLDAVDAKIIIAGEGEELLGALEEISNYLREHDIKVWALTERPAKEYQFIDIHNDVDAAPKDPIPREKRQHVRKNDDALYIFTSGTTGLPKAARISHGRLAEGSFIADLYNIKKDDVYYITLPLYHSAGFQISLSSALRLGATVVLSPKFSASRFWQDARQHRVTVIFYVGEMCRYLMMQPESESDKENDVWLAVGNGLRPDIWIKFPKRFEIPYLGEFYGATDGNLFAMNPDNKVGACGCFSPFLKKLFGFELVMYDFDKAVPVRDRNGRCIPVQHGQTGLMLTRVNKLAPFSGYRGREELSEKKRVRDAFKDGDVYLNTGDIFALDKDYYLYFMDRLGDTFRWKGENVATTEVAQIVLSYPGIVEANVYGVSVPGQEGRAGMAAVVMEDEDNFNFEEFYSHLTTYLPLYACPKFIRTQSEMATTGTYKYTKVKLVEDGFDPNAVDDPMYFMDVDRKSFVPMNNFVYQRIISGNARI
ncbi:long-chain fatty acid transport protein 2-like [Ptychodera flava]|uniref:long-chain fatty acid transport protein 2-like n=1 Tax=Ptychodera flava TaxID=63121 RepID=UPI003969E5CA